jgi:O-antigen/teichoic acid export membrane protein
MRPPYEWFKGGRTVRDTSRTIALSALSGTAQRVVQILGMLLVTPLLLTALGRDQFGVWGAVTSLLWMTGLADLGIGFPLITHIARSQSVGGDKLAGAFVAAAATITLLPLVSGLMAAILIAASSRGHGPLYAIAIAALALNAPLGLANRIWVGLHKAYVANAWDLLQALLYFALLTMATYGGATLTALVGLPYLALVLSNLGSTVLLFARYPQLRPFELAAARTAIRIMMREAAMYLALMAAGLLAIWCDNLIAVYLLGEGDSAVISVALRIGLGGMALLDAAATPYWPEFAESLASNDTNRIRQLLISGTVIITAAAICGAATIVHFGQPLLRLWLGDRLTIPMDVLWALAAWLVVQSMGKAASLLMNARSEISFQARWVMAFGLVALLGKFGLVALHAGVAGILWATTLAYSAVIIPPYAVRLARLYWPKVNAT